jgi:hypothetical protein
MAYEISKNMVICSIFLAALSSPLSLDSGDKMVLLLGIPIFSTGHPHLFHRPPPSFPLSVPIFSTGRTLILPSPGEIRVTNVLHTRYFPLAIPIHANARKEAAGLANVSERTLSRLESGERPPYMPARKERRSCESRVPWSRCFSGLLLHAHRPETEADNARWDVAHDGDPKEQTQGEGWSEGLVRAERAGEDLLLDQGLGLLDEARRQLASALDRRQVPHVEVHEPHLTLLQRSGEHVRNDHGILDGVIDPYPADRAHDVCGVPDEQ